jgi:hypothetical protein
MALSSIQPDIAQKKEFNRSGLPYVGNIGVHTPAALQLLKLRPAFYAKQWHDVKDVTVSPGFLTERY